MIKATVRRVARPAVMMLSAVAAALLAASGADAQTGVTRSVVASGGGRASIPGSVAIHFTLGQGICGAVESGDVETLVGFWMGGPITTTSTPPTVGDLASPTVFRLYRSYPNPATLRSVIAFDVPVSTEGTLEIYNAAGRRVRVLLEGTVHPGRGRIVWDGTNDNGTRVSAGIYFYKLTTSHYVASHRLMWLQ